MRKSTCAKLPSRAMTARKRHRKVLKTAHVKTCSLRNKVNEIHNLLVTDDIHILTISGTHLDNNTL